MFRDAGADGPRGPRTGQWISNIERGVQQIPIEDLPLFARFLNVDVRWLLTGEASGMTEFVARMAEIETALDARGVRLLLRLALQQVEELRDYPQ